MKKKRAFTLLEIMIVIFLIGLIGSVIGYNMKGSLEEGKAFKTKQAIMKIREIFELEIAKGASEQDIADDPARYLKASGLVSKPEKMIKDGWGQRFSIKANEGKLKISSAKLSTYKQKKTKIRGIDVESEE